MQIKISRIAENNIKEVFDYIVPNSLKYAEKAVRDIRSRIRNLKEFPYIGRYVPERRDKLYRELIYKNYRIIYSVYEKKEEILIHFVIHTSRNFKKIFNSYIKKSF
ncbi:MAG: type II toxin-antitoxin system RelE/ParE family toxin [Oscillospiraceae bacterium]|nr:type II toxin-antitoxin system RelE/ParE family toxin [Oscillospiraceae bacterium]